MGQKTARSRELVALSARVAQWRKESGGGRGSRIPEALWEEAVRVARIAGLYPTARALRFRYDRLKARCHATAKEALPATEYSDAPGTGGTLASRKKAGVAARTDDGQRQSGPVASGTAETPRFIALPMPTERRSITIELAGARGDQLRVEVRGDFDVTDLVQRVNPAQFRRVAAYEAEFGVTIKRSLSVVQEADRGAPYPNMRSADILASSERFAEPIILPIGQWTLPAGAFGDANGPI